MANIVGKGFDKGRAWASVDGLGWAGDGKLDFEPDDEKIHLTVVTQAGWEKLLIDRLWSIR